jgi:hypothetical protein
MLMVVEAFEVLVISGGARKFFLDGPLKNYIAYKNLNYNICTKLRIKITYIIILHIY